jgi:diguanylate cyclase (GGDEF)-like protein
MARNELHGAQARRRLSYGAIGALLSLGAPLGLLLLRLLRSGTVSPARIRAELATDVATYTYVTVSSGIVFALFGSALGRHADRLAELAITDGLTGLRNARALRERLRRELNRAARYGQPLSLLLIDVDGLKAINDGLGHPAGDRALRHVGEAIRSQLRESDVGARWGGDEFALLAPNTSRSAAAALARRVRSLVANSPVDGDLPPLTASIGIATFDDAVDTGADPVILMQAADAALYDAKRAGRDRYVIVSLRRGHRKREFEGQAHATHDPRPRVSDLRRPRCLSQRRSSRMRESRYDGSAPRHWRSMPSSLRP